MKLVESATPSIPRRYIDQVTGTLDPKVSQACAGFLITSPTTSDRQETQILLRCSILNHLSCYLTIIVTAQGTIGNQSKTNRKDTGPIYGVSTLDQFGMLCEIHYHSWEPLGNDQLFSMVSHFGNHTEI